MYNSQIGQDKLVDKYLNFKNGGYFLDLGAHQYKHISNTYFFEYSRQWKGIAIDNDQIYEQEWKEMRPNSIFIHQDATLIDYQSLIEQYNFPKIIDYLSIDLEPPGTTLDALFKVFNSDLQFLTISFEVDDYRQKITKDISREFLKERGYHFIIELYDQIPSGEKIHVDDFWIHSSLL
jgi:hypothetical protein